MENVEAFFENYFGERTAIRRSDVCHGSGKRKDGITACPLCKGAGWKLMGESQESSQ